MEKAKIDYDAYGEKIFVCPVCDYVNDLLETDKAGDEVDCEVCENTFELED